MIAARWAWAKMAQLLLELRVCARRSLLRRVGRGDRPPDHGKARLANKPGLGGESVEVNRGQSG